VLGDRRINSTLATSCGGTIADISSPHAVAEEG